MEELSAIYPVKTLHELYEAAIGAEPRSFWFVNLVAKAKDDMFFLRFEHKKPRRMTDPTSNLNSVQADKYFAWDPASKSHVNLQCSIVGLAPALARCRA